MNNSIKYLFFSLVICSLVSCKQDLEPTFEFSKEIDNYTPYLGVEVYEEANAHILLKFGEYFEKGNSPTTASFAANFFDDNEELMDVGLLTIGDEKLTAHAGTNRYLSYPSIIPEDYMGQAVSVDLQSTSRKFSNFETTINISPAMNVTSSIGVEDYFDKNQDLELRWDASPTISKAYLAVCAEGVNCIIREIEDNGEYVLGKENFVDFPVGGDVLIHLGRGIQNCFGDNQEKICITALIDTRPGALEIR